MNRPRLKDILRLLEDMIPSQVSEDWDNTGLQVGDPSQEIGKIFLALDPTHHAIKEAGKRNAQLLLTHHPLIFKPLTSLNRGIPPGDVIFEAMEMRISIISSHTNLDVIDGGINDMLAGLLRLHDVDILDPKGGLNTSRVGLGRIGYLPEPVRLRSLSILAKSIFGNDSIKIVGRKDRVIKRIAVVGGSGGNLVRKAWRQGADLLITGDVRHHEALEARSLGLALMDAGHFYTERAALKLFAESLERRFKEMGWRVGVEFYHNEKCPLP
jgi:GTP cyclohydrolase I